MSFLPNVPRLSLGDRKVLPPGCPIGERLVRVFHGASFSGVVGYGLTDYIEIVNRPIVPKATSESPWRANSRIVGVARFPETGRT